MSKAACILFPFLFLVISCATPKTTENDLSTWQGSRDALLRSAKSGEYDYIMDNLLARDLVDSMIARYGEETWRTEFRKSKLESLPFYFRWLKNCDVRTSGGKIFLNGEAGCYATFMNVGGLYFLLDVGQHITSM